MRKITTEMNALILPPTLDGSVFDGQVDHFFGRGHQEVQGFLVGGVARTGAGTQRQLQAVRDV